MKGFLLIFGSLLLSSILVTLIFAAIFWFTL